jgi:hypothetical protein
VEPSGTKRPWRESKKLLAGKPHNLLLFTLGINNGLRVNDLMGLKVGQLRGLKGSEPL